MVKRTGGPSDDGTRWYWVVIWIAIPALEIEVMILDLPFMAHDPEEATEIVWMIYTEHAYDHKSKSWRMGGLPVFPWHIAAAECPEYLALRLADEHKKNLKNQGKNTDESMDCLNRQVHDKVVRLFPNSKLPSDQESKNDLS